MTGKNDYSGTTVITAGRLIVNGQHTGKGIVTVRKGATLAGTGSLAGAVTVNIGGTLQVGDTLVTDHGLTFSGGLKLNNGAILQVNDAMMDHNYQAGDEIHAFSGNVTGTFSEIQPAIPGEGLIWDTSELYAKGLLKVAAGSSIGNILTEKENSSVYDLTGHRHTTASKGIFIQDNKKIVRK